MIVNADALRIPLADGAVHCVVTSPPYWGLRDYGIDGQLGLEPTPDEYVAKMVQVFREVWRVLREDGTCWLNLGDSYATGTTAGRPDYSPTGQVGANRPEAQNSVARNGNPFGLAAKQLCGIPWRVAFALQADGWWLRSDIIWSKPNPMPESVTDRPTKAHEYIFLLSKTPRYYYDAEAVKEPSVYPDDDRKGRADEAQKRMPTNSVNGVRPRKQDQVGKSTYTGFNDRYDSRGPYPTRNRRTVWTIATAPYSGAHFAVYPPALVEPCIKAGTSERGVCPVCGAPWERVVEVGPLTATDSGKGTLGKKYNDDDQTGWNEEDFKPRHYRPRNTTGWRPTCAHDAEPVPAIVFDPFNGSGTTGLVAQQLGRAYIGLDLSFPYLRLAKDRLGMTALEEWTNGIQAGPDGYHDLPLFQAEDR